MHGITFSILVVDDDEDDRFILDEAFKEIGYDSEVRKFLSGEYLFKYLEKIDSSLYPALIVLDNTLPGMDATEIVSLLRNNAAYKEIPVVIHTTAISPEKQKTLSALGVEAVIVKGAEMNEIIKIARKLKNIAEAHRKV